MAMIPRSTIRCLHRIAWSALGALVALAGGAPAASAPPSTLEGAWRLAEQRYASGGHNLAAEEISLVLRIGPPGSGGPGARKVLFEASGGAEGAAPPRSAAWPAFVTDEGPRPLHVLARDARDTQPCLRASYEVRPSDADELVLRIEERYCLEAGGRDLAGEMTVRFVEGDAERGSFVLHRRFEREP